MILLFILLVKLMLGSLNMVVLPITEHVGELPVPYEWLMIYVRALYQYFESILQKVYWQYGPMES